MENVWQILWVKFTQQLNKTQLAPAGHTEENERTALDDEKEVVVEEEGQFISAKFW